jgi:hypothetical protein
MKTAIVEIREMVGQYFMVVQAKSDRDGALAGISVPILANQTIQPDEKRNRIQGFLDAWAKEIWLGPETPNYKAINDTLTKKIQELETSLASKTAELKNAYDRMAAEEQLRIGMNNQIAAANKSAHEAVAQLTDANIQLVAANKRIKELEQSTKTSTTKKRLF